jgi:hypothetical protein
VKENLADRLEKAAEQLERVERGEDAGPERRERAMSRLLRRLEGIAERMSAPASPPPATEPRARPVAEADPPEDVAADSRSVDVAARDGRLVVWERGRPVRVVTARERGRGTRTSLRLPRGLLGTELYDHDKGDET